ncbi:MAG: methyltransferase domain-containing protein [Deltaproteobacteria bacterium]
MEPVSVILPISPMRASLGESARRAARTSGVGELLLVASSAADREAASPLLGERGVRLIEAAPGRGNALKAGFASARGTAAVVLADGGFSDLSALARPILDDRADLVLGSRYLGDERPVGGFWRALGDRAVSVLAGAAVDLTLTDLAGAKAVRRSVAEELVLRETGDGIDAELVAKLARLRCRIVEVPASASSTPLRPREWAPLLLSALRYSALEGVVRDGGHHTLEVMDQAPRYAEWLVRRMRPHLGERVLEVGAGIGTITRHLADRELVVPLDVAAHYVRRLEATFADRPNVRPMLADAGALDMERLSAERFDTCILSNVLEHLPDDGAVLRQLYELLPVGGRIVLVVPANPWLYGSMDREVGHHRRYTRASLDQVVRSAGFRVERLEPLNLLGVPGWFVNARLLRRRAVPLLQLSLYDRLVPLLAALEARLPPVTGLSFFCVGRKEG